MKKRLSLQELQDLEYDILCSVADLCEEHGLRYGLSGGTLLGAVRHGGFIPWDDDIDIVMPRPDYMEFIRISNKLPERYSLSSPYSDLDNIHAYCKVYDLSTKMIEFPNGKKIYIHVYIDIFPVDGMPNNPILQEKHRLKCRRRMLLLYMFRVAKFKLNETTGIKRIFWKSISVLQKNLIGLKQIEYVDKICLRYDFDESQFCSVIVAGYGFKEIMPSVVYQLDGMIKFRDRFFNTFRFPEYYLINIYDNYMKLPPENQRHCHDNEAYLVEDIKITD